MLIERHGAGVRANVLLPVGRRRRSLERWFKRGVAALTCLPWTAETGLRWARLLADLRAGGKAMPIKDSLIAATAPVHRLIVVTRNTRDFRNAGVRVLDPFV
jgi:predicted nucleic acid-binding protein